MDKTTILLILALIVLVMGRGGMRALTRHG
jgi:hypothetical protein